MLKQDIHFLQIFFSEFDQLLLKIKEIDWINNVKKKYLWITILIFILQNMLEMQLKMLYKKYCDQLWLVND